MDTFHAVKHSLLMKIDQFILNNKRKGFLKTFRKTATWKIVSGPFAFANNSAQPLFENEIFEASYLY